MNDRPTCAICEVAWATGDDGLCDGCRAAIIANRQTAQQTLPCKPPEPRVERWWSDE